MTTPSRDSERALPDRLWGFRTLRAVLLATLAIVNVGGIANMLPVAGQSKPVALLLLVGGNAMVGIAALLVRAGREQAAGAFIC
ncbi:MAG: hypothetical protein ACHQNV_07750, partial [Vicinamibacteria bacterium]